MEVMFNNKAYHRLEIDSAFTLGLPREVVYAFRKRIRYIRSANDLKALYAMKSLHFEKLKGKRSGQYSMRLNDQWRLILELVHKSENVAVVIISIVDYH